MIPSLMHQKLFSIYDAKIFKDAYDAMIAPRIDWEATLEELQQRIDENPYGDFFSADSLDELAKKASEALGLDYDTVLESINTYNDMCEAGDDAYFGKPKEYMQKLENPPYYFCYMPQACMVTFGGIRTNRKMEVVDKSGAPIAGLYSAGVDSADLWPNIYTINVPWKSMRTTSIPAVSQANSQQSTSATRKQATSLRTATRAHQSLIRRGPCPKERSKTANTPTPNSACSATSRSR